MTQKFIHPTYQGTHTCGHSFSKQILEATPRKRLAVLRMMESMKCNECIKATAK